MEEKNNQSINQEPEKELTEQEIAKLRSKQIKWYQEQIVLAELRSKLSEFNAKAVLYELQRKEAIIKLAQLNPPVNPNQEENGSKENREEE